MALAPTSEELLGIGLAAAQAARNELLLDDGDVSEQILAAGAAMADACVEHAARRYRQTFVDGCSGQELAERITDRFKDLTRKAAAAAGVALTFNRATAAAGAGFIPAGAICATATDSEGKRQEFETTADVFYAVGEVGSKTVLAAARATGAAGNVAAGAVSLIVSAVFDSSLTVTNAAASAGGADEEDDESYKSRYRDFFRTLPRGTKAAVELGARSVPGVATVSVSVDSLGIMTIYVADAAGGSTQALIDAVEEELINWVAVGAVFSVVGGEVLLQNITIRVRLTRGRAADVEGITQKAVTAELLKLSAGDALFRSKLTTSVQNLDRERFEDVDVELPSANVTPAPQQIIRAGTIQVLDAI